MNVYEPLLIKGLLEGKITAKQAENYPSTDTTTNKRIAGVESLLHAGASYPISAQDVFVTVCKLHGQDEQSIRDRLTLVKEVELTENYEAILTISANLTHAKKCSDLVADSLSSKDYDLGKLREYIGNIQPDTATSGHFSALQDLITTDTCAPRGQPVSLIPSFSTETAALFGLVVIGGPTGVGKSQLAMQLAMDWVGDVYYIDLEVGADTLGWRLKSRFTDADELAARIQGFEYSNQHTDFTLACSLPVEDEPKLIILDSLNKAMDAKDDKRKTIDSTLRLCDKAKLAGHTVIVTCELNSDGQYKESGEIIHTADTGLIMKEAPHAPSLRTLYICKNRHYKLRNTKLCDLMERMWHWEEA